MKRILTVRGLVLSSLLLSGVLTADAQPKQIRIKTLDVKKFIRLTADDVNFRRTPDANSGKLMEWNSDAGSFETSTILYYSDRNNGRYRADNNTGAYVAPYHIAKYGILPVCNENADWCNVEIQGRENVVQPWMMKRFGQIINVVETPGGPPLPAYYVTDENGDQRSVGTAMAVNRKKGIYKNLAFSVAQRPDSDGMEVCFQFKLPGNIYSAAVRMDVSVERDAAGNKFDIETLTEYGMDDEEYTVLKVIIPTKENITAQMLKACLQICPDDMFGKLVKTAFPEDGIVHPSEVVFRSDTGKFYMVSFDSKLRSVFPANTYIVNLY